MKKHFPSHDALLARRMQGIAPFHVMRLLERARQLEAGGRSIIHMEVGEPDFPTPSTITAAGIHALEQGRTHYTPATGIPELKAAIAGYYAKRYGVKIDPARVIVTPGSSGALQLVMNMLINPGEQVMMTDPGYPCNRHFVRLVGGNALSVPVGPDSNYQLNSAIVREYWQESVRAVMIASPSNPVGSCLEAEQISDLIDWLAERRAFLIMDEIYQGLNFGHESFTALQADADNLFVINSFSKYFGMTGWRLGWMIVPDGYAGAADRLSQNLFLAPQTMAQYAALEAFSDETMRELEARRAEFQRRRDYLLPALEKLGFRARSTPLGAFYLYMDCSALTDDSFAFCERLLEEAGVAITPGLDFGSYQQNTHVRFAYTTDMEQLKRAVERIRDFLGKSIN